MATSTQSFHEAAMAVIQKTPKSGFREPGKSICFDLFLSLYTLKKVEENVFDELPHAKV
jgi:hypothetical protein